MAKKLAFKVGDIVKNSVGQFTKILSIKDERYGLSGWATLPNAKKSTVVTTFLNVFAMEELDLETVSGSKDDSTSSNDQTGGSNDDKSDDKPTKSALSKLSAEEVKAKAVELGLNADGNKAETLELLYTHFEL